MFYTRCYVALIIMKKIEYLEELPEGVLKQIQLDMELEDGDKIEDLEEIFDYIKDCVGYQNEPKKKGDYYYLQFCKMFNGYKIIAQSKRFIKDYDCICDEQFDGIYI